MLTSTIETIPSNVPIKHTPIVTQDLKLIKLNNQIQDKLYTSSNKTKLEDKNVIITTSSSSSSSMDDTEYNEKRTQTCSLNKTNLKDIYKNLNDLDELNTKDYLIDYFYNENFIYDPTPNPKIVKSKTRNPEFNDWCDGICEWQPVHAYPSFKNYIQSFRNKIKTRRNDMIEFDQDLGFYVPMSKVKTPQVDKPPVSTTNYTNANPVNLNTLNNPYASNKLMKELNKIAYNQHEYSRRSSSATSNKRCLTIKPAALPFATSDNNSLYSQLQLRSDELDRVRNQPKNYRLDYKNLNPNYKLAQEHLNNIQLTKPSQLFSVDELNKYDNEDDSRSTNRLYVHKSESDTTIRNSSSYLLNNNHTLNNLSSKLLKVSSLNVNNQPLTANEILERHKFYLDGDLNEQVNNELLHNQLYVKHNYNKNNKKLNQPSPLTRPLLVNTSSSTGLYVHNSPKHDGKSTDLELNISNSAPSSGSTALPPIVAGKRINLPLGQHRYAQYHRPNKAHLYKIPV